MPFAASGRNAAWCPSPWVLGSFSQVTSEDRHIRGRNCARPYPIPRCILKILDELSTFTSCQTTRWVGLMNSKSTSLCQSTISHSTKVDLFCARNLYIYIWNLFWFRIDHYHAPVSKHGNRGKIHVIYALIIANGGRFLVVHFHAIQTGYTPVVKISNVINIRKVEK